MPKKKVFFIIPIVFTILFFVFYYMPNILPALNTIYISIMIFLFATLAGFFISRQATRYNQIISKVTDFDGNMSSLYREFELFGKDEQNEYKKIAIKHYSKILNASSWDAYFDTKTNTLSSTYKLIFVITAGKKLDNLRNAATIRITTSLDSMQKIRKNIIALYKEKIPMFQWVLILFLITTLIATISAMPSHKEIFQSILKSSFSTSIIAIAIMLWKLNHLTFFETMIGKSSGQDVLDIIEGKK